MSPKSKRCLALPFLDNLLFWMMALHLFLCGLQIFGGTAAGTSCCQLNLERKWLEGHRRISSVRWGWRRSNIRYCSIRNNWMPSQGTTTRGNGLELFPSFYPSEAQDSFSSRSLHEIGWARAPASVLVDHPCMAVSVRRIISPKQNRTRKGDLRVHAGQAKSQRPPISLTELHEAHSSHYPQNTMAQCLVTECA